MTPRQLAELRGYVSPWTASGRGILLVLAGLVAGALFRGLVRSFVPQADRKGSCCE